jgi:hypothetical protein
MHHGFSLDPLPAGRGTELTDVIETPRVRRLCRLMGFELAKQPEADSSDRMIRPGFLDSESRQYLIELVRDASVAHRLARRASALVLLDDGMSCEAIAKVLLLDDDTIRTWHRTLIPLYQVGPDMVCLSE